MPLCRRTSKPIIRTELDAKIALARRLRNDRGEIRYYKCEFCHKYHLTSQEKRS